MAENNEFIREVNEDYRRDQVAPGGRVVSGLIERGVSRLAAGRTVKGAFGLRAFADVDCVPLPGFAAPRGFAF